MERKFIKKSLATILSIIMIVTSVTITPVKIVSAKNYADGGCVSWVKDRVSQKLGISLPGTGVNKYGLYGANNYWNVLNYSKGSEPRANSIAVWEYTSGSYMNYGHIAFVESVNGNNVTVSEGGYQWWDSKGVYHTDYYLGNQGVTCRTTTKDGIKTLGGCSGFKGYIYLTEDTKPIISSPSAPRSVSLNCSEIGLNDALTVSWNASDGATKYNVNLVCTTNSSYNQSTTVGGTSASFSIKNAGTYKVTVSASNSAGTSGSTSSGNCVAHENVTVKYVDWDNQLITTQNIKWGGNASAPTAPEREGYTFQNWSSDGKTVKTDTTIKAVYKINTYSVSFVDYNGDVIDKVQKVNYMSSATEPTEIPCKKGYIFAGWSTNEYKSVKKSLTVKATYVWENTDLPIVTEITSAARNDEGTGYTINVNLTNFPDNFTKGKLVVALMTKSGKMVASETRTISMPEEDEVSEKITVLYSGLASRVQVSMIGVIDDDTTGTPKSKIVTSAVDIGNEWSDWSTTVPDGEDIIKESRTEYRYRDSKVIKSTGTPTTPAGYSLTNTANSGTYTAWGGWSGWSRNWVGSNSLTEVQSQNGYRVYAFVCSRCGRRDPLGGACSGCAQYTLVWNQTEDTMSGYQRGYDLKAQNGDNLSGTGRARVIINGVTWYFELNGYSNGETGTGQVIYTIYRYRTRQEYKNYTYWMTEFSDWQEEKVEASTDKKVETRTTYRFKTNSTEVPCYNYKRYKYTNINNGKIVYTYTSKYADSMEYPGEWEYNTAFTELKKISTVDDNIELYNGTGEDSWYRADVNSESSSTEYLTEDTLEDKTGVKRIVEGDLPNSAGKVATLLVYKGQNEDPIASQIEYISQVKIGEDGHYKFDFITKEEPTAKTGDFIITLGIEGSTNYQVIGKIDAPKQVFTVDFVDDEGNSIGEQKKVADGGTVESPVVPEKEGYEFIGWDTGLKNIRENMVITAQYKKKKFTVIFVDWDNTSLEIKEFEYGDKLTTDNIPTKEGQKFDKWVDSSSKEISIVTGNMIVEASYKDTKYTVIFKDWDGNVISEQQIAYGEKAVAPDDLEAPNDMQVFKCWDNNVNLDYITCDMIVSPTAEYLYDSDTPNFTIDSGSYNDTQNIALYSTNGNTDIYYCALSEEECINTNEWVDENSFIKYETPITISENTVILAYANTKNKNSSEIVRKEYIIGDETTSENVTTTQQTTTNVDTTSAQEQITSNEIVSTTKIDSESTIQPITTTREIETNPNTVAKPSGLVGVEDSNKNYNIFWQIVPDAVYYNIYLNGIIISNTTTANYTISKSAFGHSGEYIVEVQAVGVNCISEKSSVIYVVENDATDTTMTVKETTTSVQTTTTSKQPTTTGSSQVTLKNQTITTAKIKALKKDSLKKKKAVIKLKAKSSGNGKLTYKVISYPNKMKKYISVSKKGVITLKKGAKKGSYKIKITALKTSTYNEAYKTVTIKVK